MGMTPDDYAYDEAMAEIEELRQEELLDGFQQWRRRTERRLDKKGLRKTTARLVACNAIFGLENACIVGEPGERTRTLEDNSPPQGHFDWHPYGRPKSMSHLISRAIKEGLMEVNGNTLSLTDEAVLYLRHNNTIDEGRLFHYYAFTQGVVPWPTSNPWATGEAKQAEADQFQTEPYQYLDMLNTFQDPSPAVRERYEDLSAYKIGLLTTAIHGHDAKGVFGYLDAVDRETVVRTVVAALEVPEWDRDDKVEAILSKGRAADQVQALLDLHKRARPDEDAEVVVGECVARVGWVIVRRLVQYRVNIPRAMPATRPSASEARHLRDFRKWLEMQRAGGRPDLEIAGVPFQFKGIGADRNVAAVANALANEASKITEAFEVLSDVGTRLNLDLSILGEARPSAPLPGPTAS